MSQALGAALADLVIAVAVVGAFVGVNAASTAPRWSTLMAAARLVLTVALAVVAVGAIAAVVPGDPVARALGEDAPDSARAQMRETLGLHHQDALTGPLRPLRPLAAGGRVCRGLVVGVVDPQRLRSHRGEPVWALVAPRLASSAALGAGAVALGLVVGVAFGLVAAARRALPRAALIVEGVVVVVAATPRLVIGPALVFGLAVVWRVLPAGGDGAWAWIIPTVTLAAPFGAVVARHVRAAAIDADDERFAAAAAARGLSPSMVALRHVLPHALIPVVQLTGLQAGAVLSGALVVERVCAWPGLATLLLERLQRGDLAVVTAIVAVSVVIVVAANAAADAAARAVDPRARAPGKRST